MFDYFRESKRRSGLVTLVLACVFMGGWVRSFVVADQLFIHTRHDALYWLISNNGWFGAVVLTGNIHKPPLMVVTHRTEIGHPSAFGTNPFDGIPTLWQWSSSPHMILPHYVIVLPLTMITAYLLLSKPRPKATSGPQPGTR